MYLYAIIVILILIIIYFIVRPTDRVNKTDIIKTLYRQCARWSTASTQDENPLIANLHANYAAGYLWALEDLFTADEISSATGISHKVFRSEIQKNQDITTRKVLSSCPKFAQMNNNASKLVANIAEEL